LQVCVWDLDLAKEQVRAEEEKIKPQENNNWHKPHHPATIPYHR
jgi:hypothetical protein